jgi:hypothetical protein
MQKVSDPSVAATFRAFPAPARTRLMVLRALIYRVAKQADCELEESLKWGEPAYRAKGGSTIRLGWKAKAPHEVAMYFICTTGLVDTFRDLYPHSFRFSGNRALLFDLGSKVQEKALAHCIALALTYHKR